VGVSFGVSGVGTEGGGVTDSATPGGAEGFMNEPMAANSVLGGGAFGSAW
jgi:hypothetical protein